MKICVYANLSKDNAEQLVVAFFNYAKNNNISVYLASSLSEIIHCDVVVVFGGDGTVLKVATAVAEKNIPIFAINVGNVGYLTECDSNQMFEAFDKVLAKEYQILERTLLQANVRGVTYLALNEFVFSGKTRSNTVSLTLKINDYLIDKFVGDGMIISSPTGSTAYSLAARGPILSPTINGTVITPLCTHSLFNHPIVIDSSDDITIIGDGICLYADGQLVDEDISIVDIVKSVNTVKFIDVFNNNFYVRLKSKLTNKYNSKEVQ